MATSGTLESIAIALARLFAPLREELQVGRIRVLFAELGLEFPASLETKTAFVNELQQAVARAAQMPELVGQLIEQIEAEDVPEIVSVATDLFETVTSLVDGFSKIATELKNLAGSFPEIPAADLITFADNLPKNILDYLIVKTLEGTPGLAEALEFIDAVERVDHLSGTLAYTTRKVKLDQFTNFISKPGEKLGNLYGWGQPSFDGVALFRTLENLLAKSGVPAIFDEAAVPPTLDLIYLEAKPRTDLDPKGIEIQLLDKIIVESEEYGQDDWRIKVAFDAEMKSGVRIIAQPNGNVSFIPPSGDLQGEASIEWIAGNRNGQPYLILGQPGGSRLEARQLSAKIGVGFAWNSSTSQASGDFMIGGEVKGGKFFVDFSQGDGFLSQILSNVKLESDFDLGFGFSSKDGLFFYGSSTLLIQLPLHIDLIVVEVQALTIGVGFASGKFPISLGVDFTANLGPLHAAIEQIGLKADLSFPSNQDGNLGPVDLVLGFKPPLGVGLSIDAGVVTGGGYLRFDPDREEYDGILALDLAGIVSVTAIALITTKMPDGSKGFSLLLIITAEFGTPIQLGLGFTLSGVGGLLGLNRTMRLEVIAAGIRDGGINSIMFPQNVIENATRIISDLKNYFPPEEGTFLIGPMVKLGWGTPNLVTLSMGIIIEIPGNIAILGVLQIALPDEDAALIIIQVSFIGAIEFDKNRLWFFASLFGSRILFMTLEGEMGLLVAWGSEPNFVVSVGGFHPAFNPPPLPFGGIARLAISILNTDFARIRVEAYFAVTSNSVQFGAAAELFFGVSAFNIEGHLAFDALFRFSPFYFIITISASLSVTVFGIGLFSVRMRGSLEGPTPWRVEGTGSISLLFFDIDVDFSHTWGDEEETTLPPIAVMPLLEAEFQKLENWLPIIPTGNRLLVSLRTIEPGTTDLILHPLGSLKISQRAIPLGLTIDKVGNQKPSDANHFNVTVTGFDERAEAKESFAIGQYLSKSDSELLSAKSFEPLKGGVDISISGEQYRAPLAVRRVVRYEKIIIDTYFKRFVKRLFPWISTLFNLFLSGNATALSSLSKKSEKQLKPFDDRVQIGSTLYVVARSEDNSPYAEEAVGFTSHAQAQDFLRKQVAADGSLAKQLHVIPQVEMQRTE